MTTRTTGWMRIDLVVFESSVQWARYILLLVLVEFMDFDVV